MKSNLKGVSIVTHGNGVVLAITHRKRQQTCKKTSKPAESGQTRDAVIHRKINKNDKINLKRCSTLLIIKNI